MEQVNSSSRSGKDTIINVNDLVEQLTPPTRGRKGREIQHTTTPRLTISRIPEKVLDTMTSLGIEFGVNDKREFIVNKNTAWEVFEGDGTNNGKPGATLGKMKLTITGTTRDLTIKPMGWPSEPNRNPKLIVQVISDNTDGTRDTIFLTREFPEVKSLLNPGEATISGMTLDGKTLHAIIGVGRDYMKTGFDGVIFDGKRYKRHDDAIFNNRSGLVTIYEYEGELYRLEGRSFLKDEGIHHDRFDKVKE